MGPAGTALGSFQGRWLQNGGGGGQHPAADPRQAQERGEVWGGDVCVKACAQGTVLEWRCDDGQKTAFRSHFALSILFGGRVSLASAISLHTSS